MYLQIVAIAADSPEEAEESGEVVFSLRPREYPVHLEEGEFLGFIHDERLGGSAFDLDTIQQSEEIPKYILLYFSYRSGEGTRVPKSKSGEMDRIDEDILDELVEDEDNPRRMETSRIIECCH